MNESVRFLECPDCGTLTLEVERLSLDEQGRECTKLGRCSECGESFRCVWFKSILTECDKQPSAP
jgi:predicted RNA-binding Zn-ribbon protein involved in translation (DUF1610 family)